MSSIQTDLIVGIDMAAQPKKTGICVMEWGPQRGAGYVRELELEVDDDQICERIPKARCTGIDVPLGWPDAFVRAVCAHAAGEEWPPAEKDELRLRATDHHARGRRKFPPLSVSSDKIGVPAMRCARVQTLCARQSVNCARDGSGKIVEVYPAASLSIWGIRDHGYKKRDRQNERREILEQLLRRLPRLEMASEDQEKCVKSDDMLDALVAAITAWLHVSDLCEPIPDGLTGEAKREGWIALPRANALSRLDPDSDFGSEAKRCDR